MELDELREDPFISDWLDDINRENTERSYL